MIIKDRVGEIIKSVRSLIKTDVLVGVPGSSSSRPDDEITNAMIGYIAEFGSPANNIPARPHLLEGIRSAKEAISAQLGKAAKSAIERNRDGVSKGQNAAGLIAQSAVRSKITEGPFVPLKPSTLKARRSKGRNGEKPLIDTGQYRRSITYVVRPKGK